MENRGPESHKSVLLQEVIDYLALKPGDAAIDATTGAGGHSEAILKAIGPRGRLLCIDQDESALAIARNRLADYSNVKFAKGNFAEIEEIARENGFSKVKGILADLGVSSMQLDQAERGFSFSKRAKLDMRMDQKNQLTAAQIINDYSEKDLASIFKEYGEEKFAKSIAREIVKERKTNPIIWTDQLSEVVRRGMRSNFKSHLNPATKVFQALRIEVNKELIVLTTALPQMVSVLASGGKMAIISFHSLEDRIVKRFIEEQSKKCVCPPEYPKCVCDTKPTLKKITKKPVLPSEEETRQNPRARSAKLRVAEII